VISSLGLVEWSRRWKLLKGQTEIVGPLELVFVLAWYLRWTVLVMIVGGLWLAKHWCLSLVDGLEVVEALEEPLEEQCWQE
jgi:hypothetical protein